VERWKERGRKGRDKQRETVERWKEKGRKGRDKQRERNGEREGGLERETYSYTSKLTWIFTPRWGTNSGTMTLLSAAFIVVMSLQCAMPYRAGGAGAGG